VKSRPENIVLFSSLASLAALRQLTKLGIARVGDKLNWINHPKFLKIRDETLDQFQAKEFNFRKVKPVIFLCGGFENPRRDRLAQYLRRNHPETLVLYADNVWPFIANRSELNALEMEAELADLADMVLYRIRFSGHKFFLSRQGRVLS